MDILQLELSENTQAFIAAQVAAGGFNSAGDYVLFLLREAEKQKAWNQVNALVREGIQSGEPIEVTADFWANKKQRLHARFPHEGES